MQPKVEIDVKVEYIRIERMNMTTEAPSLSIEDECVLASREHHRMFTFQHHCDGCDSQTRDYSPPVGRCFLFH